MYYNGNSNRRLYYDQDDYGYEDDDDDDDDVLVRAALERIARARTRGKTNVSLTMEEMEALERRTPLPQPQQHQQQQQQREATPPSTPKSSKSKLHGKSNSLSNLINGKTRKKSSSPAAPKVTPKSNTKAKISRKLSADGAAVPTWNGPSVLVQGPDGIPMYAPLATYPPEYAPMSRSRSRSTSQGQRDSTTPPEQQYAPFPILYYPGTGRPASSGSIRAYADEQEGSPRRNRSGSSAAQYRVSEEYSSVPAAHGRRNLSGPPDIAFSTLRRVPPASSPLVPRPATLQHSHSDPNVPARKYESSSNSGEDNVQVEVIPDLDGGYSVNRAPVKEETRRRRSRR